MMNKLQTCLLLNLILIICCRENVSDIQRTEFFTDGKYSIVATNEDIPEAYRSEVYFDGTSLIIDSSGINVILVQKNSTPFFEVCGANLPASCPESFALCYASDDGVEANLFCPNNLGVIGYSNGQIRSMKARLFKFTSPCTQFFVKPDPEWETDKLYAKLPKGNFQKISPIYRILRQPLINSPLDKAYEQISLRVSGNYCGKPLRFPEAYLAIVKPPPPEEPSTTTPIPTTTTVSTTFAAVKLSTTKNSKSTTEAASSGTGLILGIVLGSIAGILVLIIIAAVVFRYVIKKRLQKTSTIPFVPRDTKSMESLVLPPTILQPTPYLDPALEDKTQEDSKSIVRTAPTQPSKSNDNIVKPSGEAATAVVAKPTESFTRDQATKGKEGSGDNKKENQKESSSSEIPLPALVIDSTKKYTKIYKSDFDRGQEDSIASEENCGENIYKIDAFCVCAFPLPDQTMGTWPPDYVENMAVRASTIEQRGIWHLQAVIMANNLLVKKGIKNKRGAITGDEKAMKWLRGKTTIPFVQFIADSVENAADGSGSEFLGSKIQWRRYLKKIDLMETYRQSCWIGQTKQRREFFLLAAFYKMEQLCKQFPCEEDLKTFPFPVPMLLEVRKEAPQFFEILDQPKPPASENKAAPSEPPPSGERANKDKKSLEPLQPPPVPHPVIATSALGGMLPSLKDKPKPAPNQPQGIATLSDKKKSHKESKSSNKDPLDSS